MRSLESARATCDRVLPGLCKALADIPFADREAPGSPVIGLFREHGGPGLLIPTGYGGHGADPVEAVRVTRALGSYSPSLAVGTAMHHFTAAMLFSLAATADRLTGAQREVLAGIAPRKQLMASGWAEGRTGQNILRPAVTAVPAPDGGFLLSGAKKPCSLSRSMDLLTASTAVPDADGAPSLALALVPADSPGITVHPFWANDVLTGTESNEVRLTDVHVDADLVVRTTQDDPTRLDDLQTGGFVWFEMIISACYAGAAAALVDEVLSRERGSVTDRAALAVSSESAYALLEGTARAVRDGLDGDEAVAAVLVARFAAQDTMAAAADQALELLGGIDFISSPDNARLARSVRPLAFHPPSRTSTAEPLLGYFTGGPLHLS
ncbi:acyl-CoA dehydrogenase family protein [Streptomyces iconiensis]|uniref:Acyl-CoA dehydrogenase family protein n=1 Tax=Streptomyces iconiensis TaxID=1384038 RepID=A0ABT7A389_9ACTN|nr:acyl-CoA dehydrogenase family protein [Streptomyces iconiensis]MDJ1135803.1 acyl-CoA dehydrogenase family protein [Streptomyces iconiensis]